MLEGIRKRASANLSMLYYLLFKPSCVMNLEGGSSGATP
jgi:hypothetical protein